jgi:hypothetical protein
VIRADGQRAYFFGVGSSSWSLTRYPLPWLGPMPLTDVAETIAHGRLAARGSHRLAVTANGSHLSLLVDDQPVWDGVDPQPDAPSDGRFGFWALVGATDDALAAFANAVLEEPDGGCGLTARAGANASSLLLRGAGFSRETPIAITVGIGGETFALAGMTDKEGGFTQEVRPAVGRQAGDGFIVTAVSSTCTARVTGEPARTRILFEGTFGAGTQEWASSMPSPKLTAMA